ncbi:ROK family protein, partial [Oleiphilus sp. HI0080]
MHLGIDLGGTKIEIIVLDNTNQVQHRKRIASPRDSYQQTLSALVDLVEDAEDKVGQRCSVGVGIPGSLSPSTGLVQNANSTWLIGHPLKQDLENCLQREIKIANDADCFTLSEACDG